MTLVRTRLCEMLPLHRVPIAADRRRYNWRQYGNDASQSSFPSRRQGQDNVPPTAGDSFRGRRQQPRRDQVLRRVSKCGSGTDDLY